MITNNNISQSTESIIVFIDTTNASQKALQYGCIQAKKNNFKLEILAVIEASHRNLLFGAQAIGDQKKIQMERRVERERKSFYIYR
jgi:hypothetical protein